MPRLKARTDSNHSEVVKALRQIGASELDLSAVGKGCPDLAVGWRGRVSVLITAAAAFRAREERAGRSVMLYLQKSFTIAPPSKITACELCVYGTGAHATWCQEANDEWLRDIEWWEWVKGARDFLE